MKERTNRSFFCALIIEPLQAASIRLLLGMDLSLHFNDNPRVRIRH